MHSKAIIQSHWVGFLCLVPFLVMLAVHRLLGLSDALMVQTPPGERAAHTFNLIMAGVFFIGIAAFAVHAFAFARGHRAWLVAKPRAGRVSFKFGRSRPPASVSIWR